jgi:hypothetical protein
VDPGKVYVDRESGEEFEIVGKLLPLAPSPSNLPWAVENLRLCGCSLEQLAPKDLNDCPTCGRRLPALARMDGREETEEPARGTDYSARQNVVRGEEPGGQDRGGQERAGHDPGAEDASGKDPPEHEDAA